MSFLPELRQVVVPSRTSIRRPSVGPRGTWLTDAHGLVPPATANPFLKSFACALAVYVTATGLLLLLVAPHVSVGVLAVGSTLSALGVFAATSFVPAVITGMIVRQSPRVWRFSRIAAVYLPLFLLTAGWQFGDRLADAWSPMALIARVIN
ncbi:MAG: hypothetical protein KIT36_03350 [Alphaproteobacteria bacterium]|nr:hypothetical protein [Alphaproteobacteria bacterium]